MWRLGGAKCKKAGGEDALKPWLGDGRDLRGG